MSAQPALFGAPSALRGEAPAPKPKPKPRHPYSPPVRWWRLLVFRIPCGRLLVMPYSGKFGTLRRWRGWIGEHPQLVERRFLRVEVSEGPPRRLKVRRRDGIPRDLGEGGKGGKVADAVTRYEERLRMASHRVATLYPPPEDPPAARDTHTHSRDEVKDGNHRWLRGCRRAEDCAPGQYAYRNVCSCPECHRAVKERDRRPEARPWSGEYRPEIIYVTEEGEYAHRAAAPARIWMGWEGGISAWASWDTFAERYEGASPKST